MVHAEINIFFHVFEEQGKRGVLDLSQFVSQYFRFFSEDLKIKSNTPQESEHRDTTSIWYFCPKKQNKTKKWKKSSGRTANICMPCEVSRTEDYNSTGIIFSLIPHGGKFCLSSNSTTKNNLALIFYHSSLNYCWLKRFCLVVWYYVTTRKKCNVKMERWRWPVFRWVIRWNKHNTKLPYLNKWCCVTIYSA